MPAATVLHPPVGPDRPQRRRLDCSHCAFRDTGRRRGRVWSFRGCGRRGWPASVSRDHGILRLGAEVKAGYGLNVAPDPGSGYARELTGCAAGPELFMPGILRARNCRQRKAGACGRYSYRDFVPRHGDQAWRFNAGRRCCAGIFMNLVPAVHPPQLRCGAGAAGRAGDRGVDGLRGGGHRPGRYPPASSRLRRPAGRPALAVPVRNSPGRAAQREAAAHHRPGPQPHHLSHLRGALAVERTYPRRRTHPSESWLCHLARTRCHALT